MQKVKSWQNKRAFKDNLLYLLIAVLKYNFFNLDFLKARIFNSVNSCQRVRIQLLDSLLMLINTYHYGNIEFWQRESEGKERQ